MSKSDRIVDRLLESEDFDLEAFWREAVAQTVGDMAQTDKQLVGRLKKGVYAYIKWVNAPDEMNSGMDAEELAEVRSSLRAAKTFGEVEQILRTHESEPTFLSMVQSGYFL